MFDVPSKVIKDLSVFETLEKDTASEFCKLVVTQLSKLYLFDKADVQNKSTSSNSWCFGVSQKILESAAKRLRGNNLKVSSEDIASSLQAIAHIYVESAKHKIDSDSLSIFLKDKVLNQILIPKRQPISYLLTFKF